MVEQIVKEYSVDSLGDDFAILDPDPPHMDRSMFIVAKVALYGRSGSIFMSAHGMSIWSGRGTPSLLGEIP